MAWAGWLGVDELAARACHAAAVAGEGKEARVQHEAECSAVP